MSKSKTFIIFQDNADARPFIDAVEQDNPDISIDYQPGMVRFENEGELIIRRETVEEIIGREVDLQEIHVHLVSIGGNIEEDDDYIRLVWN
ncbi:MAG: monooxygenase [Gammaproteobacteria bacterium]|nr:MAG: monooxygenase [Gammaproteobacteria bacterium]RLA24493.1 MAG: monooxygenase [Gammaproteobacteria bacterium]